MRLLAIALSSFLALGVAGCPRPIPDPPDHWQCQYNQPSGGVYAFYCVNNRTQEKLKIPTTAPSMKGAQCLSPKDFKAMSKWADNVKLIAQESCR